MPLLQKHVKVKYEERFQDFKILQTIKFFRNKIDPLILKKKIVTQLIINYELSFNRCSNGLMSFSQSTLKLILDLMM